MSSKHENYPTWFNAHTAPWKVHEPQKRIMSRVDTGFEVVIGDGDEFFPDQIFEKGKRYYFDKEYGYNDDPDVYKIKEFEEKEIDNPYYKNNLSAYQEYQKQIKEWPILKARWDKEEEAWQTEVEKQTLAKLKAKYEK